MKIDIHKHYFGYYADKSEVNQLGKFQVGEIVIDWYGEVGCILAISKNGDVRTDSNGMGDIKALKKVRSVSKLTAYLKELHHADMSFMQSEHDRELLQLASI